MAPSCLLQGVVERPAVDRIPQLLVREPDGSGVKSLEDIELDVRVGVFRNDYATYGPVQQTTPITVRDLREGLSIQLVKHRKTTKLETVCILSFGGKPPDRLQPLLTVNDLEGPILILGEVADRDRNVKQQGLDEAAGFRVVPDVAALVFELEEEPPGVDVFDKAGDREVIRLGDQATFVRCQVEWLGALLILFLKLDLLEIGFARCTITL
jgi:hypothetical protein